MQFFLQNGILKLSIFHPIILDGKQIGTLYFLVNLKNLTAQLYHSALLLLMAAWCLSCCSSFLSPQDCSI